MSLLHTLEVQNTQNKIWNNRRRTYIDKSDCKEGESICKKCKGVGEFINEEHHHSLPTICPQCCGRGIVDWITQAVERPPTQMGSHSSSSSSSCSTTYHKSPLPNYKPVKLVSNPGMICTKQVTNYKRRKIV